ncbi:MAG: 30S ribosomal protein S24e [Candidatus Bathyarchaeia archaeon]
MKMRMISTRLNPLLDRREIYFEIIDESTPSRDRVRKELAANLKVDLERVWIRNLKTQTGTRRTIGRAHVYEESSRGLQIEPKYIINRNKAEIGSKEGEKE